MIREGIQDLGAGQDVESDEENIVRKHHECGEDVGNFALSEYMVSEIA